VVCDGETGSDAIEWRVITEAATNADCAEGGSVILSGPDSDRSGDLSEIEIVTRTPICNGGSAAELQAFIVFIVDRGGWNDLCDGWRPHRRRI
jgi:hypothetical protein